MQKIAPSLVLLYQASIKQSIAPTKWKHALVTPIFKKKMIVHWHQTTDQYPLHVFVGNYWSTSFIEAAEFTQYFIQCLTWAFVQNAHAKLSFYLLFMTLPVV